MRQNILKTRICCEDCLKYITSKQELSSHSRIQIVNGRFSNFKYYRKGIERKDHGEKFFQGIMHVNTYNLYIND